MRRHTTTMLFVAIHLVLAATAARAETVDGTVAETTSRWDGDAIVTEADVVDANGAHVRVIQLGGVVDGTGMVFSHVPAVVKRGERVVIDVDRAGVIQRVRSRTAAPAPAGTIAFATPAAGTAAYGLQRTTSGNTLWRASGCISLSYDEASVTPTIAAVLDQAFGAWSEAVDKAKCGGLSISRSFARGLPADADGISTVRVRTQKWCRPASLVSPEICYPPEAAAVTRLVFTDAPGSSDDGEILEADMELNAVNFQLLEPGASATAGAAKPALYLRAVATHEAGHLVGLGHDCGTGTEPWPMDGSGKGVPSCDGASGETLAATMYFAVGELDDSASTLEPTDVAGACAIAKTQSCEEEVLGGCSAAPVELGTDGRTKFPALSLVALVVIALVAQRGRRRPRRG